MRLIIINFSLLSNCLFLIASSNKMTRLSGGRLKAGGNYTLKLISSTLKSKLRFYSDSLPCMPFLDGALTRLPFLPR